jgi:hypothetical protein
MVVSMQYRIGQAKIRHYKSSLSSESHSDRGYMFTTSTMSTGQLTCPRKIYQEEYSRILEHYLSCKQSGIETICYMTFPIFWYIAPCSAYMSRRFGGRYHLQLQGRKSAELETSPANGYWATPPSSYPLVPI